MNILAIDTATEACSVALLYNDQIFSAFEICPQQHSQRLLPMIQEVLEKGDVSLVDLDCLAFGRGPGSFTGVRIATGMIQGLALGTDLPVVGISTLQTMAQQAIETNQCKLVTAAIDARMNEVYFAQFDAVNGLAKLKSEECVLPPSEAKQALQPMETMGVGTGWHAYGELVAEQVSVNEEVLYPNARFMLELAKQGYQNGEGVSVNDISPVYLRDKVTWKKLPGRE